MNFNYFKILLKALCAGLFLITVFTCGQIKAEGARWEELSIYGGQIYTLAVDPGNSFRIYAGSWNGDGFFISDDEGLNWTSDSWFRNSAVYDIEIDPNDPDTIWVANDHEIDRSTDGGETWSSYTLPDGRFCYTVEVDPNDESGQTVFAGTGPKSGETTGGTVFETYDGGENWAPHTDLTDEFTTFSILDLDFNPANLDVWATSNTFNTSNNSGIYVYTNEDGDWKWSGWEQDFYMDEFLFHPTDGKTLFACGDGGIWKKSDGEALTAWEDSFDNDAFFARAMCIPAKNTEKLYAAMIEDDVTPVVIVGESPWKSGTGAWSYTTENAPDEFICLAADDLSPYYLYAGGTNNGVFRSTDNGTTWNSISSGMLANSIYDSDVSPEDSSELLLATLGGVYKNTSSVPLNDYSAYSVTYHPEDEDIMYAGFGWGLSKSTDGGETWNFFNPLKYVTGYTGESYRVLSVEVSPDGGTVFAGVSMDVGNDGYVLRILDDGEDFASSYFYYSHSATPVNTVAVHPGNPEMVFIGMGNFYAPVTAGALNRSTNGGVNWSFVKMGSAQEGDSVVVNDIAIEQKSPYTMYAACGGSNLYHSGIYKSPDNGSTWIKKEGGLPDNYAVTDIRIDPTDSNIVYAAIYKGYDDNCTYSSCTDMNGVYVSYDAGEYWSPLGLSDYYMYDVNVFNTGSAASRTRTLGRSFSYPSADVYGGSASGGHSTSMSTGRGNVIGIIKSSGTGEPVEDADIMSLTSMSKCKTDANGFFNLSTATGIHRISIRANSHSSYSASNVRVVTGGFTNIGEISLSSGTPGPDPVPDDNTCILEDILGVRQDKALDPFRGFRDNVLKKTAYGRGLTDLYYSSGAEILEALGKSPELRQKSLKIIRRFIPLFRSINDHERATFSTEFLNEVSAFLFKLEKIVSPALKQKIYEMRLSIKKDDLFERLSRKEQVQQTDLAGKTVAPAKICYPANND